MKRISFITLSFIISFALVMTVSIIPECAADNWYPYRGYFEYNISDNGKSTITIDNSTQLFLEISMGGSQRIWEIAARGDWSANNGFGALDGYYVDYVDITCNIDWMAWGTDKTVTSRAVSNKGRGSSGSYDEWFYFYDPICGYGVATVTITVTMQVHWYVVYVIIPEIWELRFGPYYSTNTVSRSLTTYIDNLEPAY